MEWVGDVAAWLGGLIMSMLSGVWAWLSALLSQNAELVGGGLLLLFFFWIFQTVTK